MTTELIVMRLADMTRVHPDQITSRCSKCNEEVGVYPSGQNVMREMDDVVLVCQVCKGKFNLFGTHLAPGAASEPFESVDRPLAMDEGAGDAMHGKKKP